MHNLRTVIRFEITRTLKKKSFWIAALSIPVIGVFIGLIIFFANKTSDEQAQNLASERYSIGITDESHTIPKTTLQSIGATTFATQTDGEQSVKAGQLDAYFYIPKDIATQPIKIYGKEVGIFENSRYQSFAEQLLQQSVKADVAPNDLAIISKTVKYDTVTYINGEVDKGFLKLIAPGMFLILFYLMIATFGNQMLTSITEEKENRVIEMILATIKPTTLLVGKLLSLIALALIQMTVTLIPIVLGYLLLRDQLTLPNLDISQIPLDPVAISIGAVIFFASFLLFSGLLMTIGAAMPTAKEAGGFFGGAMTLLFGPLYAAPLFITSPDSLIVQFLSYFPLTAPIPLLLRNAAGNLSLTEAAIATVILLAAAAFVTSIGVRIFKFGALEYSRRLSIKEVMRRKH
jgi:ABC-2 type transport system permease protein